MFYLSEIGSYLLKDCNWIPGPPDLFNPRRVADCFMQMCKKYRAALCGNLRCRWI